MKLTGSRCQCRECGEYFNSTGAFAQHRYGPMTKRACYAVAEMEKRGHERDLHGAWKMRSGMQNENAA